MVGSEEKRRLIADYRDALEERRAVARSAAGLTIVALVAAVGVIDAVPGEMDAAKVRANPDAATASATSNAAKSRANPHAKVGANAEAGNVRTNPDAAKVSGKRVATGR